MQMKSLIIDVQQELEKKTNDQSSGAIRECFLRGQQWMRASVCGDRGVLPT